MCLLSHWGYMYYIDVVYFRIGVRTWLEQTSWLHLQLLFAGAATQVTQLRSYAVTDIVATVAAFLRRRSYSGYAATQLLSYRHRGYRCSFSSRAQLLRVSRKVSVEVAARGAREGVADHESELSQQILGF